MHDAHIHLDFMSNAELVARAAREAGCALFATTVTPEGFNDAQTRFANARNVTVGLGLHPWWVKHSEDANSLARLVESVWLVGEVGLDFSKRYEETRAEQLAAFTTIARACAQQGEKVLSIHSVRAARETLDILEDAGAFEACTCIFHWYSGPSDQLKRAIEAGCMFSVNERMLNTGKGREYVKAIPLAQLLLETDAPPEQGKPYSFELVKAELARTAGLVEAIKGDGALIAIEDNFNRLVERHAAGA